MSVYAASIQPAQLRLGGELAIWSDTVAAQLSRQRGALISRDL